MPGVGRVELKNLAAVVPGTLDETIVIVAHRDNNGRTAGANDNASGTAALVELARPYATVGTTESARTPLHTLVFLSTDGGAYGALGAARFAARSPLARRAAAVISLDGLAGAARPRLELAGLDGHSPPPALVETATRRVASETGTRPAPPCRADAARLARAAVRLRRAGPAPRLRCPGDPHRDGLRRGNAGRQRRARGPRPPAARTARQSLRDAAQLARRRRRGADLDGRRGVPGRPRGARVGAPAPSARRGRCRLPRRRWTSSRVAGCGDYRSAPRGGRSAREGASGWCSSSSSVSPAWPAHSRPSRGCRRRRISPPSTPGRSASRRSSSSRRRSCGCARERGSSRASGRRRRRSSRRTRSRSSRCSCSAGSWRSSPRTASCSCSPRSTPGSGCRSFGARRDGSPTSSSGSG